MRTLPPKDPDSIVDYDNIWTYWLNSDTIVTSVWDVTSGTVVIDDTDSTTTVTKVWLSGGTVGELAVLHNRITTAAGRTEDRSFQIQIKSK